MLNFTLGSTQNIYFTGTENATISAPYFLFVFTNKITEEVVKVMATNISTTERFDKFSLIINNYFVTSTLGMWGYNIYQKSSSSDMTVSGLIVESGYMFLRPATAFTPTEYTNQSNAFVTYGE